MNTMNRNTNYRRPQALGNQVGISGGKVEDPNPCIPDAEIAE